MTIMVHLEGWITGVIDAMVLLHLPLVTRILGEQFHRCKEPTSVSSGDALFSCLAGTRAGQSELDWLVCGCCVAIIPERQRQHKLLCRSSR